MRIKKMFVFVFFSAREVLVVEESVGAVSVDAAAAVAVLDEGEVEALVRELRRAHEVAAAVVVAGLVGRGWAEGGDAVCAVRTQLEFCAAKRLGIECGECRLGLESGGLGQLLCCRE